MPFPFGFCVKCFYVVFSSLAFFLGVPAVSLPPEDTVVILVKLDTLPPGAGAEPAELLALLCRVKELTISAPIAAHPSVLKVPAFDVHLLGLFVLILLSLLHGLLEELIVLDHPGNLSFCFGFIHR